MTIRMHRLLVKAFPAALLAIAVTLPALAGNPSAAATHYRWKDPSGVVHFSDTIPASALAGGYDIVNNNGLVVRHVPRELTPEERKAAAAEAARDASMKRIRQQQNMEDSQLLTAYPTEQDLAHSQQGQLQQIRLDIGTLQTNLRSQENTLTDLLSHAADLEHSGKPIPPGVSRTIAEQRTTVNGERKAIAQRQSDLTEATAKFASQLARYRALRSKYGSADSASESQP